MKRILIALMLFLCVVARGAVISFTATNSFGQPDTNSFLVIPVSTINNADGSFTTTGLPRRYFPNTNGYWQTNLLQQNWQFTNQFFNFLIRAPLDSGPTIYPAGQLLISGAPGGPVGVFVTVMVTNGGTNGNVSFNQVTNGLGFAPLANTNLPALTNGFISANETANLATTNAVLNASNSLQGGINLTLTNLYATNNGLVSVQNRNGYIPTNFDALGAAGTVGSNLTNRLNNASNFLFQLPLTNAYPTNAPFSIVGQSLFVPTNFDASGAAATVGANLTNTLNFASNALQTQIGAAGISATTATNIANSQTAISSNFLSGQSVTNIYGTNAATISSAGQRFYIPTNFDVAGAAATIGTNFTNGLNTASNSLQAQIIAGGINAVTATNIANSQAAIGSNFLAGFSITNAYGTNAALSVVSQKIFVPTNYDASGAAATVGMNDTNNALSISNSLSTLSLTNAYGTNATTLLYTGQKLYVPTNFDTAGAAATAVGTLGSNLTNALSNTSNVLSALSITNAYGTNAVTVILSGQKVYIPTNFDTAGAASAIGTALTNDVNAIGANGSNDTRALFISTNTAYQSQFQGSNTTYQTQFQNTNTAVQSQFSALGTAATNLSNIGSNGAFVGAVLASTNAPFIAAPLTITSSGATGLSWSNASGSMNSWLSTGSPFEELEIQALGFANIGLSVGSNYVKSPNFTATNNITAGGNLSVAGSVTVGSATVATSDGTNGIYFTSFTGAAGPVMTNGEFIWTNAFNCYSNPSTGAFVSNILASPMTWQAYSNAATTVCNLTNSTAVGNWNSTGGGTGSSTNMVSLYGNAVDFQGIPFLRAVPAVIQNQFTLASNTLASFTYIKNNIGIGTNTTFLTYSNPGPTGAVFTNDTGNAVNSPSNVMLNFFGAGPNNIPQIEATGPSGYYGGLYWNTTHDNPLGRPQDTEVPLVSPDRIAIVPNLTLTGDDPACQFGGVGSPTRWFFNWATNVFTGIGSTPSDGVLWKSGYRTNGSAFIISPEIVSTTVSNVAGKGWDSHFFIAHESGYWGNEIGDPDVNKAIVGVDLEMNTNGNGLYTGVTLNGRTNGNIAASIALVGSQITTTSNLVAGDYADDWWQAPKQFSAGGGSFAGRNVVINGDAFTIGTSDTSANFQIFSQSGGGPVNSLMISGGNFNYTAFPKGGISVGGALTPGTANTIMIATNAAVAGWPATQDGAVQLLLSNQDLYYVTKQKTNLIVLGH